MLASSVRDSLLPTSYKSQPLGLLPPFLPSFPHQQLQCELICHRLDSPISDIVTMPLEQAHAPIAAPYWCAPLWQALGARDCSRLPNSKDSPPHRFPASENCAWAPPSLSSRFKPRLTSLLSSASCRRMSVHRWPPEPHCPPWTPVTANELSPLL
jgi:hypothetical protein